MEFISDSIVSESFVVFKILLKHSVVDNSPSYSFCKYGDSLGVCLLCKKEHDLSLRSTSLSWLQNAEYKECNSSMIFLRSVVVISLSSS